MEIAVACTLDCILLAALLDGIGTPDPEDAYLNPLHACPHRIHRWQIFCVWYAGGEGKNLKPGFGVPSLARVLVAERWELRSLKLRRVLLRLKYEEMKLEMTGMDVKHMDWEAWASDTSTESLLPVYQSIQNNEIGQILRKEMLQETLNVIQDKRRFHMLKILWPPSVSKLSQQFVFPRMGIIFPKLVLPLRRFYLFPKHSKRRFSMNEILGWYTKDVMNEDDHLMYIAESRGK